MIQPDASTKLNNESPRDFRLALRHALTLMKPYTWFAPAWAFMVGAVASHSITLQPFEQPLQTLTDFGRLAIGIGMAGPLLVGFSQVLNDYCDRDVDAINQPDRLIPSGKVSRGTVIVVLLLLLVAALAVAAYLGQGVVWVTCLGLILAISYSLHPVRLKRNGWIGNLAVAVAYEGLAWIAGHLTFQTPITSHSLLPALLYSIGTHGIMTINDFKSVAGDRQMNIRSIPVLYGEQKAAWLAVITIDMAQIVVIILLAIWGYTISAAIVFVLLLIQLIPQRNLIKNPTNASAIRYNIVGIPPMVWGMLAAALRLG
jgi:chlorophyll synthase